MARPPKKHNRKPRTMSDLLDQLQALSVSYELTRNGHYRVNTPQGPVYMPSTPSDWRAVPNAVSLLRRHGVQI